MLYIAIHFVKRIVCEDSARTLQFQLNSAMRKAEQIGLRVPADLKKALIQIAKTEDRSLAQVCEILLRDGMLSYKEEGAKYFQRLLTRQREESE